MTYRPSKNFCLNHTLTTPPQGQNGFKNSLNTSKTPPEPSLAQNTPISHTLKIPPTSLTNPKEIPIMRTQSKVSLENSGLKTMKKPLNHHLLPNQTQNPMNSTRTRQENRHIANLQQEFDKCLHSSRATWDNLFIDHQYDFSSYLPPQNIANPSVSEIPHFEGKHPPVTTTENFWVRRGNYRLYLLSEQTKPWS